MAQIFFRVFQMWGIEFFDETAKTRRSLKPSPKSNTPTTPKKQEEKSDSVSEESRETGLQAPTLDSPLGPDSTPTESDKASVDLSPLSNQPAVSPEQAELRPGVTNDETSEEKSGDHVTPSAAGDNGSGKLHVTPNLRDESIDDGYVIIDHKGSNEKEGLPKPGIFTFVFCAF